MKFSERLENQFADTVARCFEVSVAKGKDSYQFAKKFLNSEMGIWVLTDEFIQPYNSFLYMFGLLNKELSFPDGKTYDSYVMWMYGYLVKYWVTHYGVSPKEIWKILPIDLFEFRFGFFHTQGWNYIIREATETYQRKLANQNC